jgi:hypothetical protein
MSAVHYFRLDDAAKYGLTEAIMLQNFRHWIGYNQANGKHQHDGKTWTYNSVKAFGAMFPYLTANQIRRCIESLIAQGVLVRGNYNESAYNKTSWFAFSDESFSLIDLANLPNGMGESATSHTNSKHIGKPDSQGFAPLSAAKLPTCRADAVVNLYHEILPELPSVHLLGDSRKRAINSFWKFVLTSKRSDGTPRATDAESALAWIRAYFERARSNDFLMGRGAKTQGHEGWTCSIDFLMSEKGRIQVIEKTKE